MRRRCAMIVGLLTLGFGGCAGVQEFVPTERANTQTASGYTAAQYDLWGPNGNIGEATVWSSGAYEVESGELRGTVIEVRFEIESLADQPMILSEIALDSVALGGERASSEVPVRVDGERVIAPGQDSTIRAYFVIPARYEPDDIAGFRVRWELQIGEDEVYTQRTPFVQAPQYAYYTPFHDPWLMGMGPGWYPPAWNWPGYGWGSGVWVVPQAGPMRTAIYPVHA